MQPQPHHGSHLLLSPGQPPMVVRVRHCSHQEHPDCKTPKLDLIGPAGLAVPGVVTLVGQCGRELPLRLLCSWPLHNGEALYMAVAAPLRVVDPPVAA